MQGVYEVRHVEHAQGVNEVCSYFFFLKANIVKLSRIRIVKLKHSLNMKNIKFIEIKKIRIREKLDI